MSISRRFALHKRLAADTFPILDLALSRVLLMNDARFPWLILVPRKPGLTEIFDLTRRDRGLLMEEVAHCAARLLTGTGCQKINIGALGNLVPQLHVHVVARKRGDVAWAGRVWGFRQRKVYAPAARATLSGLLKAALRA